MVRSSPLRRAGRLKAGGPIRPRRRTRKGQVSERYLDDLQSKLVRLRDKVCQIGFGVECVGPLECMHYISRDYRGVRWNEDNCAAGCKHHHTKHHDNPVIAGRFWVERIGRENCDDLWEIAQAHVRAGIPVDRHAKKAELLARLRELEGKA